MASRQDEDRERPDHWRGGLGQQAPRPGTSGPQGSPAPGYGQQQGTEFGSPESSGYGGYGGSNGPRQDDGKTGPGGRTSTAGQTGSGAETSTGGGSTDTSGSGDTGNSGLDGRK